MVYDYFFIKILVAKLFDSFSGIFFLKAITVGTVTKVYSLSSISPIIFLVTVLFVVKVLKVDLNESLDNKNLRF